MRFTTDSKGLNRLNIMCPVQTIHTFNGFCKTVISFAAINAWRDRSRRRQKEISLEHLTEEKFYPLGTTDEYFEAPYEEYPITICGQTVILTNGKLAAALLSLPERNREIIFLYFFRDYTQQKIGEMYGRCRSTTGYQIRRTLRLLHKEMEVLSHGESELLPYETIVRATSGEPEAVDEVLRHYSKRIRIAAIENGHIDRDTEDSIKQQLVASLFKFRFDG